MDIFGLIALAKSSSDKSSDKNPLNLRAQEHQ